MNNLQILLVENDPSFAHEVELLLTEMGHGLMAKISDGQEALQNILSEQPDLVIMDAGMNGELSGIEVGKRVKHLQVPIVFTASVREKSVFEATKATHSFGFLVKPIDRLTLQSVLEQAAKTIVEKGNLGECGHDVSGRVLVDDSVLIKRSNTLHKIRLSEINYVRSEGNYCTLYTDDRKFVLKTSLKKMLVELEPKRFSPVHKSYVVQLDKLDSIDLRSNKLNVADAELPLGRNYKNQLLERFRLLK